jgi:hypothetical protein
VRLLTSFAITLALSLGHAASTPADASPELKSAQAQAPKATTRSVSGTVRSSSPDTVVVTGREKGKDSEWTFAVEPTTNIRKGTKAIVASDLKPGDGVDVRFVERNGKPHVEMIRVNVRGQAAVKK